MEPFENEWFLDGHDGLFAFLVGDGKEACLVTL